MTIVEEHIALWRATVEHQQKLLERCETKDAIEYRLRLKYAQQALRGMDLFLLSLTQRPDITNDF